jgi:hypothetical protein
LPDIPVKGIKKTLINLAGRMIHISLQVYSCNKNGINIKERRSIMHIDRVFSMCPYLTGSLEGAVCGAALTLLRNIGDIHPDICLSRHFELCYLYISKLHDINIPPELSDSDKTEIVSANI